MQELVHACGAGTSRQFARDVDGRQSGLDTVVLCLRRGEATTLIFLIPVGNDEYTHVVEKGYTCNLRGGPETLVLMRSNVRVVRLAVEERGNLVERQDTCSQ